MTADSTAIEGVYRAYWSVLLGIAETAITVNLDRTGRRRGGAAAVIRATIVTSVRLVNTYRDIVMLPSTDAELVKRLLLSGVQVVITSKSVSGPMPFVPLAVIAPTTPAPTPAPPTGPGVCSTPSDIVLNDTIIDTSVNGTTYGVHQRCGWNVTAPQGFIGKLPFIGFDVEPDYDHLFVYDGIPPYAKLGDFSGSVLPADVSSPGSKMTIGFASDGDNEDKEYGGVKATVSFIPAPAPTPALG